MIELELVGVRVELPHNQPIVLLKETGGERFLPIWIGAVEATSIAFALQGVETARPMTHDLMKDLLDALQVVVQRIVVTELKDGTFYAEILMAGADGEVRVSSRPSDAIALAVRGGIPVYAEEGVLDEAGIFIDEDDESETEVEKFKEFLDTVTPEDFAQ
jgi:bifunctional DNase/RNase